MEFIRDFPILLIIIEQYSSFPRPFDPRLNRCTYGIGHIFYMKLLKLRRKPSCDRESEQHHKKIMHIVNLVKFSFNITKRGFLIRKEMGQKGFRFIEKNG